ncbi:pyrroline-5-carboxylate reductase [Pararobbsia silviterrae]|uniref:Pyrroline-5-carboxylate reductase n=1 Tax=Pararobbsia silviterrae TaxID=1792498 RepID=A0A494XKC7_9BURK|nr:pyrroline-5-carboxylate reductase [Pararobbsia silviterrae]RKP48609.1 pyrroline-5-carboxylate reductase [Pararobbsia silviterrae]
MKIAFIGGGNMASALIGGLIKQGTAAAYIYAIDPIAETRERLEKAFRIVTADAPTGKLADYDAIVLAVKPQTLKEAAEAIRPFIAERQLIISIAAGVRSGDVARWLGGHTRIVRAMPNTPALVGLGVTGLLAAPTVNQDGRELAEQVLEAVGEVVWCNSETEIDSITALSGSGPAYVFYFMEALAKAAQNLGFPADEARRLAVGTFTGAAQLAAQSDEPLSLLRERVTSKGGTTAAAIASFMESGIAEAIVKGTSAARDRAFEMGEEFGRS